MKKLILLVVLSIAFVFSSSAQSQNISRFNIGFNGALALNNMNAIFDGGIGGSVKYEFHYKKIKPRLYFTAESGYETFFVKQKLQMAYVPSTTSYIPIKGGLKYFIVSRLYAEFQAGTVLYTQHGGGSAFDYSPGIGFSFKSGFEIGVRYEEWYQTPEKHLKDDYGITGSFKDPGNFGQLALRIAERF